MRFVQFVSSLLLLISAVSCGSSTRWTRNVPSFESRFLATWANKIVESESYVEIPPLEVKRDYHMLRKGKTPTYAGCEKRYKESESRRGIKFEPYVNLGVTSGISGGIRIPIEFVRISRTSKNEQERLLFTLCLDVIETRHDEKMNLNAWALYELTRYMHTNGILRRNASTSTQPEQPAAEPENPQPPPAITPGNDSDPYQDYKTTLDTLAVLQGLQEEIREWRGEMEYWRKLFKLRPQFHPQKNSMAPLPRRADPLQGIRRVDETINRTCRNALRCRNKAVVAQRIRWLKALPEEERRKRILTLRWCQEHTKIKSTPQVWENYLRDELRKASSPR